MQRRENPYTPGAGRKPPYLAGRDNDLDDFASLIEVLGDGGAERKPYLLWPARGGQDGPACGARHPCLVIRMVHN